MTRMFSTQELLELAQLDVLGLLDADEREAFERSFRAASPETQAQIRREQTRLAGSGADALLPRVDVPMGLRARVLAAIRDAMQTMTSASRTGDDVAGRIIPDLIPSRGVNRWWRTGAIGSLAASIVFGFAALQMRADNQRLTNAQESERLSRLFFQEYGPQFENTLLNHNTKFVQFTPAAENAAVGAAKATLLLDSVNKRAQLYIKNFSEASGRYSLVVVDQNGQSRRAVLEFTPSGNGIGHEMIEDLDLEGVNGLAIIQGEPGAADATTLLRSNKL